jgi:hypothetical protein
VKSASHIRVVPAPLATCSSDQREAALIKLLAAGIAAWLRDSEKATGEAAPNPLLEGGSAMSNFPFEQTDSTDLEQEEDL